MLASKNMADPTMARCPEVLANSSGDSKVSLPETPVLLGRSAVDNLAALSNEANASSASVEQPLSACCVSWLPGAETAAGVACRTESACLRWGLEFVDLREALILCAKDKRGSMLLL